MSHFNNAHKVDMDLLI